MCEITAVTSGKGGTGKTMLASNLACTLAMKGKRVLLIDMNAGLRNLDICLGVENQVIFDLADVILGICPVGKSLIRDKRFEALYLLSASQNRSKAVVKSSHMKKLFEHLRPRFDHIIIDTPSGLGEDWLTAVSAADSAVMVMTQEFVSIRDTDTVDTMLRENGIRKRYALVNRVRSEYSTSGCFPSLGDIAESIRAQIVGIVQEDPNVHIAMNKGIPVVCKSDTYVSRNFMNICERIFAE